MLKKSAMARSAEYPARTHNAAYGEGGMSIVEFANELRAQGLSIREAATEAARERLRPILMTSFAFILGVVPLLVASGAGAGSRHSIGTGVFFGMLIATTVGVFFVPSFFAEIRMLSERGLFHRKNAAIPVAASTVAGDD